eukprot:ANDGO_02437.mRNA.1 Aldehyde reductase Ahr
MTAVTFPFTINAYACFEAKGELKPHKVTVEKLEPFEILIEVHFCGVCRSDIHLQQANWGPGMSHFPQIFGHEVVGNVLAVGSAVKTHAIGDRVALGWQAGSCMACNFCMSGEQQLCNSSVGTPLGLRGGFAHHTVADARFAIRVPDNLKSAEVAPLLCGGCTVFNPIVKNAKPGDRIGVIGIGGLGSMALQFARAIGCEAVAFTSTSSKVNDIKEQIGAHRVIVTSDEAQMRAAAGSLDLIINTLDVNMDVSTYLSTLGKQGKFVLLGGIPKVELSGTDIFGHFIAGGKCVLGSVIGSPMTIERMLNVSSYNNVRPIIEIFPHSKINEALNHTASGKARFRTVVQFKEDA